MDASAYCAPDRDAAADRAANGYFSSVTIPYCRTGRYWHPGPGIDASAHAASLRLRADAADPTSARPVPGFGARRG